MAGKKAVDLRSKLFKKFVTASLIMLLIIIILILSQFSQQFELPTRTALRYIELQPSEQKIEEIRPIERRLHQMYKWESIPQVYVPFIQAWLKNHPRWEYWFWNDLDARRLLIDHYPQHLDMYDSYSNNLLRADAARYFILHHFGGVYADMDMDSYRPVDPLVFNYTCIFSQEPYIQSRLLYDRSSIAMNAWMACASKHPFMTFAIEELPNFARPIKKIADTIQITGPVMLQESLVRYMNNTRCEHGQNCHIFIAPPDMFMPTWDKGQKSTFMHKCQRRKKLSPKQVDACNTLKAVKFANHIPANVYGNHKFLHIGYQNGKYRDDKAVDIKDIVTPRVVHRYSSVENRKKCGCP